MPDFVWRAATAAGNIEQGCLSASNSAAALRQLREQGLTPLALNDAADTGATNALGVQTGGVSSPPRSRQEKGPVNAADVMAFTSELAIMLRAGLALDNALRVLIDMSHKPSVMGLVQGILDAVKGGTPLSRALAAHRALFGDFYINMVRSGEISDRGGGGSWCVVVVALAEFSCGSAVVAIAFAQASSCGAAGAKVPADTVLAVARNPSGQWRAHAHCTAYLDGHGQQRSFAAGVGQDGSDC